MRYRILSTEAAPPPWGDPPREWRIVLRSVAERTMEALSGGAVGSDGALLLPAGQPAPVAGVRGCVPRHRGHSTGAASPGRGDGAGPHRYSVRGPVRPRPRTGRSLPVPLVLIPEGVDVEVPTTAPELLEMAADAEPVVVAAEETTKDIPVSRAYADPGKETLSIGGTRRLAVHLTHRTHFINANHDTLAGEFIAASEGSKLMLALRYLWGRFRAGAARPAVGARQGLQDPPDRHRRSLSAGGWRGDRGLLHRPGLCSGGRRGGRGSQPDPVLHRGHRSPHRQLLQPVRLRDDERLPLHPGADAGCVLGRDSVTTAISWFTDVSFGKNIRVEAPKGSEQKLLDAGSRFLGCDVGHDTVVGFWVAVAPGRFLPSHCTVVADTPSVMKRVDSGIDPLDARGATLTVRDGVLMPLRLLEGRAPEG